MPVWVEFYYNNCNDSDLICTLKRLNDDEILIPVVILQTFVIVCLLLAVLFLVYKHLIRR